MTNKINILILGYSNLVQRKITKVLIKNNIRFCVASKTSGKKESKSYDWFRDYDDALNNSKANLVYVSLANSLHYYWAKKALEKGFHVIVDKPITENLKQARKLIHVAKKKKLLISESTFFNYHKQFFEAIKLLKGVNNIKYVNVNFTIPTPKKNSIRMSKKLSGGCFMDMGPYAAGVARLFCSGKLIRLNKTIVKNKEGLIISFAVLCKFLNTTFLGFFSFGNEYKNNMILSSNDSYIDLNRAFSCPPDQNMSILVKNRNSLYKKKIKKDNTFENYLNYILKAIKKKNYSFFYKTILQDIKFREKIYK